MDSGFYHEGQPFTGRGAESIVAAARFPGDSHWFSGHFPGNPVVPGVALIALVEEAVVERESGEGRSVAITGVRRVRFRLPVRPDDVVTLEAVPAPHPNGRSYTFTMRLAGETACSGILTAEVFPRGSDRPPQTGPEHPIKIS
jgi:3-hydroxyacyl-[acyl-carrier-protein] dehydratase